MRASSTKKRNKDRGQIMHRLILMRHGIADDSFQGEDKGKPLTDEGKRSINSWESI